MLVDTGHHALGTNVEQIVALLLAEGLLGGFHFNNRKYADDDLIVGLGRPLRAVPHHARDRGRGGRSRDGADACGASSS